MSAATPACPRHTVVMVTTSYPRFAGDTFGTFMEPIARSVAALGHEVHVVAPWHPEMRRGDRDGEVRFHFFRYAPLERLYVFGYAGAMREDVRLRPAAWAVAPAALVAGWATARHVARRAGATILHGHWVIPGGVIASAAAGRLPVVVSLHGSDVYVAEQHWIARRAAAAAFGRAAWVTACSQDLLTRAVALGAAEDRAEVVPYGVDADAFRPDPAARAAERRRLELAADAPMIVAAARLVRKKGFEHLVDALGRVHDRWPAVTLVLAGDGDLATELAQRAERLGMRDRIRFVGTVSQQAIASLLAAADVAVVPSVRDESGNVDGLPNVVMEALASGTPLVATPAGGIGAVATAGQTAVLVPERDAAALAEAIDRLLAEPESRRRLGDAARAHVLEHHTWTDVARRFAAVYDRVTG